MITIVQTRPLIKFPTHTPTGCSITPVFQHHSASKVLRVDAKERKYWEQVLEKLVPYKIGRYGQLMEWSGDMDDPKDQHRHVNHLFGLHPGHTVSPITTPELSDACRVVLEHRVEIPRHILTLQRCSKTKDIS